MQKKLPGLILFWLGITAALAYVPGTPDAGIWARWAVIAILAPLALMLIDDDEAYPPGLLLWAVAVAGASILWSPDRLGGLDDLAHYLILMACFWLGHRATDLRALWLGAGVGVALNAALAVSQVFGFDAVPQVAAPAGLFVNPNLLGEAAAVAAAASLALGAWPLTIPAAIAVGLSGSKAAIGGLALAGALWLGSRHARVAGAIVGAVALSIVALIVIGHPSFAVRFDQIWMPMLADLRPFGHGVGSFAFAFPEHEWAHSEPLQAIYELGLLAAPLALIAIATAIRSCHESRSPEALVIVVVGFVALAGFPLHMPFTAMAGAVAAGHLLSCWSRVRVRRWDLRAEAC